MAPRSLLFPARPGSRCGVALIIVLGCLIFLSVLVLAFFTSVRSDLRSSKSYSDNNQTRMLADTAVNVVMTQVRQATTEAGNAWASQPGMIRTFDNTGTLAHAYKLYSAAAMQDNSQAALQGDLAAGLTALAGWSGKPALFTDLNEKVNGIYPILNPPAGTVGGYAIGANGVGAAAGAGGAVPMPVSWLYVLRDGTLAAPDPSSGTTATFATAASPPSAANPIVGRIAFWTDDETCKVNINTAGGDGVAASATDMTQVANATFWSPPYFCAPDEDQLATTQPAAGEIQRYPGHPATVALNNVLHDLGWNLSSPQFYNQLAGATISSYGITPRYAYGGSEGATQAVTAAAQVPLVPGNRLYATVDEMLFQPTPARTASALNAGDAATQQRIASARFFLTAHSRAPELNLFGQPRVSIWPVWDPSAKSGATVGNPSPIDRLLSFCATVGTKSYYFTRADCASATTDVNLARNQKLLGYLDTLAAAAIPGFGGNFDSKYGQPGARQILTEIFDYVRTVNIADATQTASNAASNQYNRPWETSAWTLGRYQVAPSVNAAWGTQGFGIFPRLNEVALQFVALGGNLSPGSPNVPLSPNYTAGVMSFYGLAQPGDIGPVSATTPATTPATYSAPAGTTAVQAFLLLNFAIPSQMYIVGGNVGASGASNPYVGGRPFCWIEVKGLDNLQLNGHPLAFPADEAMIAGGNNGGDGWGDTSWDGLSFIDMTSSGGYTRQIGKSLNTTGTLTHYPFYSAIIPVTVDATGSGTMSFTTGGKSLTITLYDGISSGATPGNKIQTYTVTLPNAVFPVPKPMPLAGTVSPTVTVGGATLTTGLSVGVTTTGGDRWTILNSVHLTTDSLIGPGDVIQSMVLAPAWSDVRTLAVGAVPASAFVTHPLWGTAPFAHSLIMAGGASLNRVGGTVPAQAMGTLVAGITPDKYAAYNAVPPRIYPIVPPTLTAGSSTVGAGDWDNGLGGAPDGPWINKADEGSVFPPNLAGGTLPYFTAGHSQNGTGPSFFSPNREVPSPGMFGSLPTGVDPAGGVPKAWQTLLFQPGPANHPGQGVPATGPPYTTPPDHLLLDLFWMPVAEPYAISEPLSTAGKVNLNYQIVPFTYITRSTALRAVLATEKVAQVSGTQAALYKLNTSSMGTGMAANARVPLNLDATLAQFGAKFSATEIFRSASQICDMYLVPQGYASSSSFATDWYATGANAPFALVGDNVRERPYTDVYSRVTTKSNTFQVHYRVQSLQKVKADVNQARWVENQDQITGEKRGSVVIERYLDPNFAALTDAAAAPAATTSLEGSYSFRTVNSVSIHP